MTALVPILLAVNFDWVTHLGGRLDRNARQEVSAVHLRGTWVTDSDLEAIAAAGEIEKVDLSLTRVTDLGLLRLKNLKNVRELNLFFAELVTDEGLAVVKNWSKIERLNFRGTKVTDNTLALLAGKETLVALDIGYAEVTDSGLQHLARIPRLRELSFGGNKMTEVGLEVLRGLAGLERLDLSGRQRTDSGLWSVGLTDLGLDPVATLANLHMLNLSGTQISAKGVAKLAGLKKLEELNLFGARRVTDEAVTYLAAMPALKWVDLKDTAVTARGFDALGKAKPALTILGDPAREPVEHSKVEYENESVRVVRFAYGPRESPKRHEHPETGGVVVVYLTDGGPIKFTREDGRVAERAAVRAGSVSIRAGAKETHEATSLGDQPSQYIRVELKTTAAGGERHVEPVMPSNADNWAKLMFDGAQVRITRLACPSRASCQANEHNTVDIHLPSGSNLWLRAGSPARFNEAPLPLDLVRIELKTGPGR